MTWHILQFDRAVFQCKRLVSMKMIHCKMNFRWFQHQESALLRQKKTYQAVLFVSFGGHIREFCPSIIHIVEFELTPKMWWSWMGNCRGIPVRGHVQEKQDMRILQHWEVIHEGQSSSILTDRRLSTGFSTSHAVFVTLDWDWSISISEVAEHFSSAQS